MSRPGAWRLPAFLLEGLVPELGGGVGDAAGLQAGWLGAGVPWTAGGGVAVQRGWLAAPTRRS